MILVTDVHYDGDARAVAAGLALAAWSDTGALGTYLARVSPIAPYEPGAFYKRELPCLLSLMAQVQGISCVVVDGYVTLSEASAPGLGAHLHAALDGRVPVVGVAKSAFRGTPASAELRRGASRQPLYVSAVGMTLDDAKRHVASMHGPHRIPAHLRGVDRLAREALAAWGK